MVKFNESDSQKRRHSLDESTCLLETQRYLKVDKEHTGQFPEFLHSDTCPSVSTFRFDFSSRSVLKGNEHLNDKSLIINVCSLPNIIDT